jgi:hypothetical protein
VHAVKPPGKYPLSLQIADVARYLSCIIFKILYTPLSFEQADTSKCNFTTELRNMTAITGKLVQLVVLLIAILAGKIQLKNE